MSAGQARQIERGASRTPARGATRYSQSSPRRPRSGYAHGYFNTIRSVTWPSIIGRTEKPGLPLMSGVTKGSPSNTISKIFGARPGADTSKCMCGGTRLLGYEPGLMVSNAQAPFASDRRNSLRRGFRLSLAGLTP